VFVLEYGVGRRYGLWGRLIAIQTENLGAFSADMERDDRRELEMQLARSIFKGGDVALDSGHFLDRSRSGSRQEHADAAEGGLAIAEQALNVARLAGDIAEMNSTRKNQQSQ
jgi:hypothetical protein